MGLGIKGIDEYDDDDCVSVFLLFLFLSIVKDFYLNE